MTPTEAVNRLIAKGLSQADIARIVTERGIPVSQATISRISNGKFGDSGFALGQALVTMCNKRRA